MINDSTNDKMWPLLEFEATSPEEYTKRCYGSMMQYWIEHPAQALMHTGSNDLGVGGAAPTGSNDLGATEAPPKVADAVHEPKHYNQGMEVIDLIEAYNLGFHEGNVVKYVCRAKFKGMELQDLKKARQYLTRKINRLEGKRTWKTND